MRLLNDKLINILLCDMYINEFQRIQYCEIVKEIWEKLKLFMNYIIYIIDKN